MIINKKEKPNIAFFGTPKFAVEILEQLKTCGGSTSTDFPLLPDLIVSTPDKASGRKLKLTPPPSKIWADENNIKTLQPQKLDESFLNELEKVLPEDKKWDLFIVAAYGKIIPQTVLNLPKYGTLNVHPSLLPKFRGPSPIHSAILEGEKETGVSIMLLDAEMDHGPIIAREKFILWENSISELPNKSDLEKQLARLGGKMLAEIIPRWLNGEIKAQEQNHNEATYCEKLKSSDGLINLEDDPILNFRKIQAFDKWPKAHFFKNKKRIIIKKARFENNPKLSVGQNKLVIEKILPEGGQEINYP